MKRLEWVFKIGLAVCLAIVFWRPFRKRRAKHCLKSARRILLVRIDNRVGEALLTTPLFDALKRADRRIEVHVLVHPKIERILDRHSQIDRLWTWTADFRTLHRLRSQHFDVVINCGNWATQSVTSAVVSRLVGASGVVVGPANFPSGWLADIGVTARSDTDNEVQQRLNLLSPLVQHNSNARLSFRNVASVERSRYDLQANDRFAVINPGGRLGLRRVPTSVFVEAARCVAKAGILPIVTWGPNEENLADAVCFGCPQARKSPPTTIDELASLMKEAALTVCNNTGPMHLSVAVGSPTLAFFLNIDMQRWGHFHAPHEMIDLTSALSAGGDVSDQIRAVVTQFLLRCKRAAATS